MSVPTLRPAGRLLRPAAVGTLVLLLALSYGLSMHLYTGGEWVLPLDDTYIYLQYARMMGAGEPFRYGPGEPSSMGTTSPVYMVLLSTGFFLGLSGESMVAATFLLSAFLLGAFAFFLLRLLGRGEGGGGALAATLVVLLTGPLTWGVFTGMEIGWTLALFSGGGLLLLREMELGAWRWAPWVLGLLAVARPEGTLFVVLLLVLIAIVPARAANPMKGNALLWVPVAFILGWITLNLAAGGSVFPNTGRPKSPFFTFGFSFSFLLQHSANFFLHVTKTLLSGLTSQSALTPLNKIDTLGFVPPFSLLLYLWAAPPRILRELRERRIGIHTLMVLWWGIGFIFVGVVSGGDHHHFRYLLPFLPAFIVYLPLGAADLARRMIPEASPSDATALRRTFWGLMLAFQAFTTVNFVLLYGQGACGFMEYRRLAQWARANLEPGAAIAALDVGIIAYESGHRIVDLFGLVDNRMARSTFYYSDYIGSKFEAIRRLPPERRPAYVMLHRIRFDEQGDDAHLAPLRRHPVFTARGVTDRFPSIGRDLTLYEMDWMEGASPGDLREEDARAAVAGKRLLCEWNAADLDGARSVHQRIRSIVPGIFPSNRIVRATAADGQLVQEGALGINGSLEFGIDKESPGSLTLALRTAYAPDPLTVMVDGSAAGTWTCPVNEGGWTEAVFTIPASSLRRRTNTITVSGRFMSAHWWIFLDPAGAR